MGGLSIRLLSLIFILLAPSDAAIDQCFYPNGDESPDYPCDRNGESTNCCGGDIGIACLSNGLCQGPNGNIIRGSCSNDNWDGCARYCLGLCH